MPYHEQIMAQYDRINEEEAKLHDILAKRATKEDRPLSAEWHRLQAIAHRERTPENIEHARQAWLVSTADEHLKRGTVPGEDDHEAEAVLAAMDEMRNAELTADRPSHSTEPAPFEVSAR
jgi:hypothetical protein